MLHHRLRYYYSTIFITTIFCSFAFFSPFLLDKLNASTLQKISETAHLTDIKQVNQDGFGEKNNRYAFAMESFKGKLYVGTSNIKRTIPGIFQFALTLPLVGDGAQIWEYTTNRSVSRSTNTSWKKVVDGGLGNKENLGVRKLFTFGDHLYAVTVNHSRGFEIWRTANGNDWEIVVKNGFGNINNTSGRGLQAFHDYLYATTENRKQGAEIWRSADGVHWENVIKGGMGNSNNGWFSDFVIFNDQLYTGTMNYFGGMSLYRSHDGLNYSLIFDGGLNSHSQWILMKLIVFKGKLYFTTMNFIKGFSVFVSEDGLTFKEVLDHGLNQRSNLYGWSMVEYDGRLYLGTFQASLMFRFGMFSLFSTIDGEKWEIENDRAFSDPNQFKYLTDELGDYGIRTLNVFDGKLFIGTATAYNSCKVYSASSRRFHSHL